MSERKKLIIDLDTGVDDAQAIALALSRPDIDVMAITCVAGNVDVENVCRNTLKTLTVCNRLDVPVYKGSNKPLIGVGIDAIFYHGKDGLGDTDTGVIVDPDTQLQKEHAVTALLRLVNTYPGEITLVTLAPLTNIALAIRMDPDFGKKLKNISIMGGNIEGKGNITVSGEFNFAADPEAAFIVLNEIGVPISLNPWEISFTETAGQPWDWYDKWVNADSPFGRFNKAIIKKFADKQRPTRPVFRSCDLNAMATVVDPSVVTMTEDVYATVELAGNYTRGLMVVDWQSFLGKPANVTLVRGMDREKARALFDNMVKEGVFEQK